MRFLPALTVVLLLTGCAVTPKAKKSDFQGAKGDVATAFASLETAAKAGDQTKICTTVLSRQLVAKLGGAKGCKATIGNVLDDADPAQLTVTPKRITLGPGKVPLTATALVASSGKKPTRSTMTLVKQGGTWRIDSLG